jgi:hypothetical protein
MDPSTSHLHQRLTGTFWCLSWINAQPTGHKADPGRNSWIPIRRQAKTIQNEPQEPAYSTAYCSAAREIQAHSKPNFCNCEPPTFGKKHHK